MKKKFKDTKVGSFLKSKGSFLLNTLGDAVPDQGFMGIVKNLLIKDDEIDAVERALEPLFLDVPMDFMRDFARAIEAAHGIKE